MLFDAIEFATHAHRGQYRKTSNVPYIYHPLSVAHILIKHGCSEEIIVAGLLHDVVEDTPATLQDIKNQFGHSVACLVNAVSEPDKSASWETRKLHTLQTLSSAPFEVLLVTCADKLDNARSLAEELEYHGEHLWDHFKRPKELQGWFYQGIVQVLSQRATRDPLVTLVCQLTVVVEEIFGPLP